ncbi:DUF6707 family protein [Cronobacter dublinensis]|uniref:DUF6707 family protein n=1 Tax=Cronobacter dublinensis TaxID=413497 RepID=UPI0023DD5242|nr:DUF6707 family protein [Cronobacter dublinensis]MDT3667984.1 DUF6707 family protein [Cronobacter dublinensis]WEP45542.1 hypothetical protein NNQ27_00990 [Cronobacter dublinensis]
MKLKSMLDSLSEKNEIIKNAISLLPSKNTKTDKAIVETLAKLAYYFNIDSKEKEAMVVCDQLANLKFNNDYDYWAWIEYALCLRVELSSKFGDSEKEQDSVSLMKEVLHSGGAIVRKIKNQVHERFMNGEGVNVDEAGNMEPDTEFEYRMIYVMKLLKIKAFGGSEFFDSNLIDAEVTKNMQLMQSILRAKNSNQIAPFK